MSVRGMRSMDAWVSKTVARDGQDLAKLSWWEKLDLGAILFHTLGGYIVLLIVLVSDGGSDPWMSVPVRFDVRGQDTGDEPMTWPAGLLAAILGGLFLLCSVALVVTGRMKSMRDGLQLSEMFTIWGFAYYVGQNDVYQIVLATFLALARSINDRFGDHEGTPLNVAVEMMSCTFPIFALINILWLEFDAGKTIKGASEIIGIMIFVWACASCMRLITAMIRLHEKPKTAYKNVDDSASAAEAGQAPTRRKSIRAAVDLTTSMRKILGGLVFAHAAVAIVLIVLTNMGSGDHHPDKVWYPIIYKIGGEREREWIYEALRIWPVIIAALPMFTYLYLYMGVGDDKVREILQNRASNKWVALGDLLTETCVAFLVAQAVGIEDVSEAVLIATTAGAVRTISQHAFRDTEGFWHIVGTRIATAAVYGMILGKALAADYHAQEEVVGVVSGVLGIEMLMAAMEAMYVASKTSDQSIFFIEHLMDTWRSLGVALLIYRGSGYVYDDVIVAGG